MIYLIVVLVLVLFAIVYFHKTKQKKLYEEKKKLRQERIKILLLSNPKADNSTYEQKEKLTENT